MRIDIEKMRMRNKDGGGLRDVWQNGSTHYDGCEYNHYCCAVEALCNEIEQLRQTVPQNNGWIGVDLDGTLSETADWSKSCDVGAPIPAMVERVKRWIAEEIEVRILTARVAVTGEFSPISKRFADDEFRDEQIALIEAWCSKHIGKVLPITSEKDFRMIELWDDRAVQVVRNSGQTFEEWVFEHPTRSDND